MILTNYPEIAIKPIPGQFGLSGFLEFAVLLMPLLSLGGIVVICYWGLGKYVIPKLVRGTISEEARLLYATPLTLATVFIIAAFLTEPITYWGLFAFLVVLTGMIEGGVIIQRLLKILSYIPTGSESDSQNRSQPGHGPVKVQQPISNSSGALNYVDRRLQDKFGIGLKKIAKEIGKRILKFWYKRKVKRTGTMAAFGGAVIIYLVADRRIESSILLAEFVFSTFVAIAAINILLWKLTKLTTVDESENRMDILPVVGALIIVTATSVARLPDVFVPRTDRASEVLSDHVPYPHRFAEALLTLPIFDFAVILLHFIGLLIGIVIAVYVWRTDRAQTTD